MPLAQTTETTVHIAHGNPACLVLMAMLQTRVRVFFGSVRRTPLRSIGRLEGFHDQESPARAAEGLACPVAARAGSPRRGGPLRLQKATIHDPV